MSGSAGSFHNPAGAPHVPVLLAEVLAYLEPRDGERMIDGTFGAGGYSRAILAKADCEVLGIDRDPAAIDEGKRLAEVSSGRLHLRHGRFSQMAELADDAGWERVDGIVLDVGVSSMQLDQSDRGFSFQADGPLDMRMGSEGTSAADVVNTLPERDLADVIFRYGEERRSRVIARRIVERRKSAAFERTGDLVDLIERTIGRGRPDAIHPATRTFQALRIYVNGELHELGAALIAAEHVLATDGRLVVVAFHSLEDRIVKRFLADRSGRSAGGSRHRPADQPEPATFRLLHRGAVTPAVEETRLNPRARSARLRAAARTEVPSRKAKPVDPGLAGLEDFPYLSADGRRVGKRDRS